MVSASQSVEHKANNAWQQLKTMGAFLVGTAGTKIQDQHSAQQNTSCAKPHA
jgi:hypothetical protein